MIKKITAVFIVIIMLLTVASQAITVITETESEKEVITEIDTTENNPFVDQEELTIERLVDESFERMFEEFLKEMELYVDTQVNAMESTFLQLSEEAILEAEKNSNTSTASTAKNSMADAQLGAGAGSKDKKAEIAELLGIEVKQDVKEEKTTEVKKEKDENKRDIVKELTVEWKKKENQEKIQKYGNKIIDQQTKILINTAFNPVYAQIRNRLNDVVPTLGTVVAKVLKRYQNTLHLDEKIGNEIRRAVGLKLKEENPKKEEFNLGTELVNAAFDAIGTDASKYAKRFMNEYGSKLLEKMGLDSDSADTLTHSIVNYVMLPIKGTLNQWTSAAKDHINGRNDLDEYTKEQAGMGFDEFAEKYGALEAQAMEDAFLKQQAELEREMRQKYNAARADAQQKMFDAVGQIAGKYAMKWYDQLDGQIQKFSKNFGKLGGSIIRGVSNQIKSWIGRNVTQCVSQFLQNQFMNANGSLKWESLKIDLNQLGVSVLLSLISDEEVAQMIDIAIGAMKGGGGFISGPVPFESYAKSYFVFTIKSGIVVGATFFTSALAFTQAAAAASGDIGNLGITSELYATTQHTTNGDMVVMTAPFGPILPLIPTEPILLFYSLTPWTPIPLAIDVMAVTNPVFIPSGFVPILPGSPVFADSAYIFCDMMENKFKDSYVQRSFSISTLARFTGQGVPATPTFKSALLTIEALEFMAFTTQSAAAGGYRNAIKDLTTHAVSRYHEEAGMFVIGPFKVDYIRSFSHTVLRGKVEFGLMTEMNIYDQNGNKIPQGTWAIMYSEDGQFDHNTKWLDEGYAFPYPKEEFYIGISQSSNENVTSISKIELKYREMQVAAYATYVSMREWWTIYTNLPPISFTVGFPPVLWWMNPVASIPIMLIIPCHSVNVTMATKYYVNHTQTINLHKKDPTIPAWETAEYTTTSSVKTSGADFISMAAGIDKNSALANSTLSIIKSYQYVSPYSSTGSSFLDSAAKAYNVYASLNHTPTMVEGLGIVLKAYDKNDWAKALLVGDAIFKKDESLYVKMIRIGAVIVENKKLQKALNGVADIVAIFEDTGDMENTDRCISAMKIAAKSGTREQRELVNTIAELYEHSKFKTEVWDAACQMDMDNETLDAYLKKRFPNLTDKERQEVMSEAKQIRSIVKNTGDAGELALDFMKLYQQSINGSITVGEGIQKMNEILGDDPNVKTLASSVDRLSKNSERKKAIMADTKLTDEEKAKLCKEEDLKLWKMLVVSAKKIDTTGEFDKAEQYFNAYENYDKIQEYKKQIEAVEKDKNLTEPEKLAKIEKIYMDIADSGIDIGGDLGIIDSKEFKNYKEQYEDIQKQYNKIEEANKEINRIQSDSTLTEEQKKQQTEKQKNIITDCSINIADITGIAEGSELKEYKKQYEAAQEVNNAIESTNKVIDAANKEITKIESNTTYTQEQKTELIQKQKKIITEQQNKQVDAVLDGLKKTDKTNKKLYNDLDDIYKQYSSLEPEATKQFIETIQHMNVGEAKQFVQSIEKAENTEDALQIFKTYSTRKELKAAAEDKEEPTRHIDSLEVDQGAQLYDDTRYTEYDTNFNITKVERPTDIWYMGDDEIDLTMSIGGVVWKDGHSGLENDYDGIRTANANGDLEKGIEGVKVTLKREDNDKIGRMNVDGNWVDAITYTDEGGYYHLTEVEAGKYYVEFEYDGQKYMATTYLSDGEKTGNQFEYMIRPDLETYDNNSKVAEDKDERREFNDRFFEVINGMAIAKDGTTQTLLDYNAKDGVSSLITLDNQGHVLEDFAMHASSKTVGITYPIDSTVTLENEDTEMLVSAGGQSDVPAYYDYNRTGEYMYHVNLGLVERSKIELSTTSDVYNVTTTVNEKKEDYIYNERGILSIFDANLKHTDEYRNTAYTRDLYNADFNLRKEDYQMNILNKFDRNGNDNTAQIKRIQQIKTEEIEQRVFVTYKFTLANRSVLQSATINEITDYFDPSYKLVEEDTYQKIQDQHGIAKDTLVAKQSFFILEDKEGATEYKLNWKQEGMVDGLQRMTTIRTYDGNLGLEDIIIGSGEEIYVFVTFELQKDTSNQLSEGPKQNIIEISNYTSLEVGSYDKEHSIGLIDRDSEPDNLSVGIWGDYEDDTDAAPLITIQRYSTDMRTINGYVWNDERNKILSTGQKIGNGLRSEAEEKINGVRVQLVEIIRDPETGEDLEYVWKEMYTGDDLYSYVVSSNSSQRGSVIENANIVKTTSLGSVRDGEYKFHDYVAGNFIVRFIYGDTYRTYLAKGSTTKRAGEEGLNEASYNGHDYKSTAYQQGNDLDADWYNFNDVALNSKFYSDAKDDKDRRKVVNAYNEETKETQSIINDRAEVLASADGREDKNYYNKDLHEELRNTTWMFADTAKLNVNVEYNTTESNGLKELSYYIENIDLGLEKRPETKLELTKEIVDIKVTLANGNVIINTAAGLSQNVNWVQNQRNKEEGYDYKRDNLKYTYRQGKIHVYMDEEIMQGANIQITYKITVTNNSEIDYTGKNGDPGYVYYTGEVYSQDQIVTTKVNKIIDYVDNSLTFRKADNPSSTNNTEGWKLVENTREFITTNDGLQIQTSKMNYETFTSYVKENYNVKDTRIIAAAYSKYVETGEITGLGTIINEGENAIGKYLSNYEILQNMKDKGYLNKDLSIVKTKTGQVKEVPITQVIVTDELENTELKPGQSASVQLVLSKTLSAQDKDSTLDYSNMAEILEYTNKVGRRDMDAIPGNQNPNADSDKDEFEYDTDFTERVIITPPTGENKAFYYVITTLVLAILTLGIVLIKKLVLGKK